MRYFLKKAISIIIIILVSVSVFFGYTYATKNLRSFVSRFSEENFGVQLSIGHVGLRLPLCLELKDVKIDDSIDIGSVRIYPSPASFLVKRGLIISKVKIIDPSVKIKKGDRKEFIIADFLKKKERQASSKIPAPDFYFSKIQIRDGTLIYEAGKENMLEFVKLKVRIESSGVYLSRDSNLHFAAKGFLKNKDSGFLSPLSVNGYIQPGNITKARLRASDIKVDTLPSIYAKYLRGVIKEGRINLTSDIQISRNNLIAECYLEGENLILTKDLEQRIDAPFIASFILLINFKSSLVKIKRLRGNFLKLIFKRS